jgi:hypothetical protein
MSGILNKNNETSTFTDGDCCVKIGKVDRFITLVNIEELAIGNNTPRADLMLLYRNEKDTLQIAFYELKNVMTILSGKKIEQMKTHILNKFHATMSLFESNSSSYNSRNNGVKLEGIFSKVVKNSTKSDKIFYVVTTEEFRSQIISLGLRFYENKDNCKIKFITEDKTFQT